MKGDDDITPATAARYLDDLTEIVARAAATTLAMPYSSVTRRIKTDLTPVTSADDASEAVIREGLSRLVPDLPVVSEENVMRSFGAPLPRSFLVVDPLDGTREFLAGRDEFTVNLAIVTGGVPLAGIIAAPAQSRLWRGIADVGAECLNLRRGSDRVQTEGPVAIRTRPAPERLTVATSRSHLDEQTEDFLSRLPVGKRYLCGSAIKFCHVAQGDADVYPRLSPTSEWDVAAGQAILTAAGGVVTAPDHAALAYGGWQRKFRVSGFLAWGDRERARAI